MTTTQRNAISSPAAGLVVYDTTTNSLAYRDATNWGYLSGASGSAGAVQFSDGSALSSDATNFFWNNTSKQLLLGTSSAFGFTAKSLIKSPSDGVLKLSNNADTDFSRLQLGGTSSAFPAIKRNSAAIDFRLADDTAFCDINVKRLKLEYDSIVTTQTSSVIQSTTTNANLVIAPNGTGALVAQIPDGTTTGGNARGSNAVDLQMVRTAAAQVANGTNSVICGGQKNTTSVEHAFIGGGSTNSVAGFDGFQSIVGGLSNTINGSGYSVISGGRTNTISTGGGSSPASVVGGQSNTAGALYAVVGGGSNTASGRGSVAFGESNNISADYASGLGYRGSGYLYGQLENASGYFAAVGDSQQSLLTARCAATLTTAATTVLSLDGTGVTNLIIPSGNNRAWNVQVNWVAVVTTITGTATGVTVGDTMTQVQTLGFKRIGGTSSLIGSANTLSTNANTSMSTASMTYSAGGSQEMALTFTAPTFTGGGSVTMRVVARIELTEVAF